MNFCRNRSSSILALTLWALGFLSVMGLILGTGVRQKMSLVKSLTFRNNLHYIADAGIKRAVFELQRDVTLEDSLRESWSSNPALFKDIRVGLGNFNVYYVFLNRDGSREQIFGIVDEERKINLNTAKLAVIKSIIEQVLEYDESRAEELAASIVDWRDSDNSLSIPIGSAEDRYYQSLRQPYDCKDYRFEVFEELLLVKGMDVCAYEGLKDFITIFGDGKININTAPRQILLALGIRDAVVEKILLFRAGEDGKEATQDDNIFDTPSNIVARLSQFESLSPDEVSSLSNLVARGVFSTSSYNFMINSQAAIGENLKRQIVCVVNKDGDTLYWRQL